MSSRGRTDATLRNVANLAILKELRQMYQVQLSRGSKFAYVIKKAISSLHKYPLQILSGKQALELNGVGPAIAHRIDKVCLAQNGAGADDARGAARPACDGQARSSGGLAGVAGSHDGTGRVDVPRYVPQFQSSTWFAMVAFHLCRRENGGDPVSSCASYPDLDISAMKNAGLTLAKFTTKGSLPKITTSTARSLVKRGVLAESGLSKKRAASRSGSSSSSPSSSAISTKKVRFTVTETGQALIAYLVKVPKAVLAIANAQASLDRSFIPTTTNSSDGSRLSIGNAASSQAHADDLWSPIAVAAAASARYRPSPGTEAYAFVKCMAEATQFGALSKESILRRVCELMNGRGVDPVGTETRLVDGSYQLSGWSIMVSTKGRGGLIHRKFVKMTRRRKRGASNASTTYTATAKGAALAESIMATLAPQVGDKRARSAVSYSDSDADDGEFLSFGEPLCDSDEEDRSSGDGSGGSGSGDSGDGYGDDDCSDSVIDLSQNDAIILKEGTSKEKSSLSRHRNKRPCVAPRKATLHSQLGSDDPSDACGSGTGVRSDGSDDSSDSDDAIVPMPAPLADRLGLAKRPSLSNSAGYDSLPEVEPGSQKSGRKKKKKKKKKTKKTKQANAKEKEKQTKTKTKFKLTSKTENVGSASLGSNKSGTDAAVFSTSLFDAVSRSSMSAQDWEIVLLLDNREQRTRVDRSYFQDRILERNVHCEIRSLPLGDMMWIIRRRRPRSQNRHPSASSSAVISEEDELVLHFIVERKRMDDLAASFIDGRYKEQKFRLQNCGLCNIVYLVEGEMSHQDRMSSKHLESAIVETEIHQGFRTHRTKHAGETVDFLCH